MSAPTAFEISKLKVAKKHGFALFAVQGSTEHPAFVYTVGLAQHNLADLLVFIPTPDDLKLMATMVSNMAHLMLEFRKEFPTTDIREIHGIKKVAKDPSVEYTFNILDEGLQKFSQRNFTCRAGYFRRVLGDPLICELQFDGMVTVADLARKQLDKAFAS